MSYILDALKKSEKERALAHIPTLRTPGQTEKKRVPLSWFLFISVLAILIVGLFAVQFWWGPPQTARLVQEEPKEKQDASALIQTERTVETQSQDETIALGAEVIELSDGPSVPVDIAHLDPSIRKRLPELSINALSYSPNQTKRFVMINQDIFREGEELDDSIVVEEIKKSTVVLSFEGRLFILRPN